MASTTGRKESDAYDGAALAASACALVAVLPAADYAGGAVVLAGAAMVPGAFVGRREQSLVYRAAWTVSAMAFAVAVAVMQFAFRYDPHLLLILMSAFLLLFRWFNLRGAREHLEIWLLTVLILAVAALKGGGLLAAAGAAGWMAASVRLMMLRAAFCGGGDGAPRSLRTGRLLVPAALGAAAAVFFFVPRAEPIRTSAGRGAAASRAAATGFTDVVSLRNLADIEEAPGTAVRVTQVNSTAPLGTMRLRISTLDTFTGWEWIRVHPTPNPLAHEAIRGPEFRLAPEAKPGGAADWFLVELAEYRGPALPLPEGADLIGGLNATTYLKRFWDGRTEMGGDTSPTSFHVRATRGATPLLSGEPMATHLYVPDSVAAEVAEVAAKAIPADAPPEERARRVTAWFARGGTYSREVRRLGEGPEALARFLREPQGHCEMFATATALVMRQAGVPARLATGFAGGEWEPGDGPAPQPRLAFGHRHAHTWVEAWIAGRGWVAFDPTPAPMFVPTQGEAVTGPVRAFLRNHREALEGYITGYDYAKQRRVLREAAARAGAAIAAFDGGMLPRMAARMKENAAEPPALALAAVLLFANAVSAFWYYRSGLYRRRRLAEELAGAPAPRDATAMLLAILAKLGAPAPRTDATPAEAILAAAAARGVDRAAAERVSELYSQWRFGHAAPETERALEQAVAALG